MCKMQSVVKWREEQQSGPGSVSFTGEETMKHGPDREIVGGKEESGEMKGRAFSLSLKVRSFRQGGSN